MAKKKMYFGTRERMTWVKCPAIDTPLSKVGWQSKSQYLNGGANVRRSATGHKEYTLTWPFASQEEADEVTDYNDGLYGTGLVYFYDPFAMKSNVMPQYWAAPRLAAEDAPPLVKGRRPTLSDTAANDYAYPTKTASYELKVGDNFASVYFPLPEGYTFHIGATGSSSSSARVVVQADGVVDTTVTDINLFTNPSTETTAANQVVRTNYNTNPLPASLTGYTKAGAVAGSVTYEATGGPTGSFPAWIKMNITGSGTDITMNMPATQTTGTLRGWSGWVYASKSGTMRITAWTYDASNVYLGSSNDISSQFNVVAGWNYVDLSLTQPALPYVKFTCNLLRGNTMASWVPGESFGVALATSSDMPGPAFTGSAQVSADSDLTVAWTGSTNASTSTASAPTVTSLTDQGLSKAISSTQWASIGSRSARLIPVGQGNDSRVSPGGDSGALRLGMVAGHKYVIRATCHLAAAQTGTLHARARKIVAFYSLAATPTTYVSVESAAAPNAAGGTDLFTVLDIPATGVEAFIRLYNGSNNYADSVWWDKIQVIDITGQDNPTSAPAYWDGSTTDVSNYTETIDYAWTGTANNSTSTRVTTTYADVPLSLMSPTTPQRTNYSVNGVTGVTVTLRGEGTLNLTSLLAQIRPDGQAVPDGKFISGKGHSGCSFDGFPNVQGYSAPEALDYQSVSVSLTEVGAWGN